MKKAEARFEYRKSPNNGQWYFRLKSPNGKTVCQSEGYIRKESCLRGIASVKAIAAGAEVRAVV